MRPGLFPINGVQQYAVSVALGGYIFYVKPRRVRGVLVEAPACSLPHFLFASFSRINVAGVVLNNDSGGVAEQRSVSELVS